MIDSKVIRQKKPAHLRKVNFNLPEINKFSLKNGLDVYFVKKNTLPFLNFTLVTDAGSKYDPAGKKGLAYLFTMLIDEGAGKYDAMQLSDQFEIIGANFSVSCDQDSTYFSLQVLKDKSEKGLELLTSILTEPHLHESDFNREKRKVKTRLLQSKDDAGGIANEVFEYRLFGHKNSYAYPVLGYEKDVDLITITDVRKFYRKHFTPSKAFMVIVGDSEVDEIRELLNSSLATWKISKQKVPELQFKSSFLPGIYFVEKKDSVQSEIRTGIISHKRNEYDFYARSILNMILGGQFSSRINLNLRENKGYTYGAYSRFTYFKSVAYFYASTSVSSENTVPAIKEILKEIELIRKGITKKELLFAQSSLIRKFPSNFESYRQIAANIVGQIIHSLPKEYFKNYVDEINKVTPERILKAAKANLHPDKLTTVVVGKRKNILNGLKEIYPGDIFELDINGAVLNKL